MLTTDSVRSKFWCEKSKEKNGQITFHFPNGMVYQGKIYERVKNKSLKLDYFNSRVSFEIKENTNGYTDLIMNNLQVDETEYGEIMAGWVSVLLNLKAVVDHGVDLRNHDKSKTWGGQGYADN